MSKSHKRRLSRSLCLQILFANNFSNNNFDEAMKNFFSTNDNDLEKNNYDNEQINYASKLFTLSIDNKKFIDNLIKEKLVNWEMNRLAIMDKLILRMSLSEMLFLDEIPPKVSITEAVEIAKIFSSSDSSSFINGIMDSIYNENFEKNKENN